MSVGLIAILHSLALALRLHAAVPALDFSEAYANASAAVHAATPSVRPELLLAMAYIESRFDPTSTSRVIGHRRVIGRYPWTRPPRHLNHHASLFCGPLQTRALSWQACLHQRERAVAYAHGVHELEVWLHDRRVRGNITRALAGYGCGNHGVLTGHCNYYPERVLWVEKRIKSAARVVRPASNRPRTNT